MHLHLNELSISIALVIYSLITETEGDRVQELSRHLKFSAANNMGTVQEGDMKGK